MLNYLNWVEALKDDSKIKREPFGSIFVVTGKMIIWQAKEIITQLFYNWEEPPRLENYADCKRVKSN